MTDKQTAGNSDDVENDVAAKLAAGEMKLIKLGLALQKARTEFDDPTKDKTDEDGYAFISFPKLAQITNTHLSNNNLCWMQSHDGRVLTTRLLHKDGGVITMQTECILNGGQSSGLSIIQDQTKKLSYLKRIHLLTVLGVMGEEPENNGELDERGGTWTGAGGGLGDGSAFAQSFAHQNFDADRDQRDLDKVMTLGNANADLSSGLIKTPVADVATVDIKPITENDTAPPANTTEKPVSSIMLKVITGIMQQNEISEEQVFMWVGCTSKELTAKTADDLLLKLNSYTPMVERESGKQ